ncbi:cell adhesion molecule 3 [Kryptolebias marmoratus]|uniref:Cell adhesion molecule 3-like n=1 Tax=Kryptolebias marmoratus TaxID=37003 RepID=A0A3Q3B2S9_KRYMA|nr:cell adhesion molecule 3 [Kryptolebias marmoratus]
MSVSSFGETTMWFFVFVIIPLSGNPASACEMTFSPPRIVVEFGSPFVANCSSSSCNNVVGMGWETPLIKGGLKKNVSSLPLNVIKVEVWDPAPMCYITFTDNAPQKLKTLQITVYQIPTRVHLNQSHWGPVSEGRLYSLQCDVDEVAPAESLSVVWYKGGKKLSEKESESEKEASSLPPKNVSLLVELEADRDDDGSEIRCEAKLNLSSDGRSPPPVRSASQKLTVIYPPTFIQPGNETLEVTSDAKITLNCTAAGNPSPTYTWHFAQFTYEKMKQLNKNESILTPEFASSGIYSCTASSPLDQKTKYFTVNVASGNRTAFAAILGGFVCLGAVLLVAGLVFVTPNGTFSFPKGNSGIL